MKPEPGIGQGTLWTPAELHTPAFEELGIPAKEVVSMSRLLKAVSTVMALSPGYVTEVEFQRAEPKTVEAHLYIDRSELRYTTAENLFMGTVHPTAEFLTISHSPRSIAREMRGKTRGSFNLEEVIVAGGPSATVIDSKGEPATREEIKARGMRSAGHTLEGYIERQEAQLAKTKAQHTMLVALEKELKSPGKAHYGAKRLDELRVAGEQAIRQAIETAAINADWESLTVDGLHKAAMYKIYGMPGHNNRRLAFFRPWTIMTRDWTRVREHNVKRALKNAQEELKIYQPALNAAKPA